MSDVDRKITELEMRLSTLERENKNLLERLALLEGRSGKTPPAAPEFKPEREPAERSLPARESFAGPVDTPRSVPPQPAAAKPAATSYEKHPYIPVPEFNAGKNKEGLKSTESMEALIGGTWLNRIGIVAFIFGLGFFLKYSFDNNWIGPTGRIIIGILAGLCLLAVGELGQRKGYRIFAQGLTGGGIASLYFSIFAAFAFYHLIGQLPAFAVMAVITATAVLLSVRYNAYAIAVLGIIGGFLTPFLLDTGRPNQVGLFSYIAILDCGILALAYFKKWRSINIISFVFTLIILGLWVASPYSSGPVWTNQVFYILFFAIFACLAIFNNMVHRVRTKPDDLILITATVAAFFILSYINLDYLYGRYIGYLSFTMALIYFVMGYLAWMRNREDRFLVLSLWGISVVFLTITMPLQLDGRWITLAWAVEAVVLLGLGCRVGNWETRGAALVVMGIAIIRLLDDAGPFLFSYSGKLFRPVFNLNMIPFAACIFALYAMSYLYRRSRDKVRAKEESLWIWLLIGGTGLVGLYLSLEVICFGNMWSRRLFGAGFRITEAIALTLAVIWLAESMILVWLGRRNNFLKAQIIGAVCFSISLLLMFGQGSRLYFDPDHLYWPVLSLRSVPYLFGVAAAVFLSSQVIRRDDLSDLEAVWPVTFALAANVLAISYLSLEVIGFYRAWGARLGLESATLNATHMTLSVVWTLYAIGLVAAGFIRKNKPLRLMSMAIFGITILKVFLFDLANLHTVYRIVSFIGVGGLLVVVSYLYQRYKDRIFGQITVQDKKEAQG